MEALEFLETYTIEQFKKLKGTSAIKVRRNTETGKLFMVFGPSKKDRGAVSQQSTFEEITEHPVISYVKGEITEQNPDGKFFLLHKEGNGGEEIATF